LEEFSPDYAAVLADVAALLERVALRQVVPNAESDDLFDPELVAMLAAKISPEDVQLYYQTAILGRRDLPLAPDPRTGFEMTLIRMLAFRPSGSGGELAAPAQAGSAAGARTGAARGSPAASAAALTTTTGAAHGSVDASNWAQVIGALELSGAARQLAANCAFVERSGNVVKLALDPRNAVMATPQQQERLAQALGDYVGAKVRLEFIDAAPAVETPSRAREKAESQVMESARKSLDNDPTVKAFKDRFGATVLEDTVRPVKS
jgi:DNA polymerase III subunit gamma/tau